MPVSLIRMLPLITGLLPIVAIHLSLVVAIDAGSIPYCIPYFEGCASISAAGRYEPAIFIFKPAMMSEWTIMVFYWLFNVAWLRSIAKEADRDPKTGRWIGILGVAGALALIVYVTFLGTQAPFYEFMRRFGVYLYFLFSVIAQIMLARHTISLSRALGLAGLERIGKAQMTLALIPFFLGALNLVLKSTLADPDPAENVIEWFFALLMHVYFVLTYYAWRDTGFDGRFRVDMPRSGLCNRASSGTGDKNITN
ncbi:MAG: hypothetical protein OEM63_15405 [Gammaproteobacteria bacterium]|nr:hypothetical protein [Gammaproteobacteria bacterium]